MCLMTSLTKHYHDDGIMCKGTVVVDDAVDEGGGSERCCICP